MSVRRVRIHTDRGGDPVSVDVALPSTAPVGELMPAIVDIVDGRSPSDAAARRWRLDRPIGGGIDESMSLADNGIHDGELLTLSQVDTPALGAVRIEPAQAAVLTQLPGSGLARLLPGTLCLFASTLASVALACAAGSEHALVNVIVAAVGTCAAAGVTVASGYGTPSSLTTVCLASATGFLAVPSTPAAPNVFLASMAGVAAALVLLRLSGRPSAALTAAGALSLLGALTTLVTLPAIVVGTALTSTSLVLLALAPRLSVLTARLEPSQRDGPGASSGDVADRVATAHATLSGLVVGAAVGGCSGVVVVVAGYASNTRGAVAFGALVALILLLRARIYVDAARRMALVAAGSTSGAACLWLIVGTHPEYVGVTGGVLVAIALLAARGARPSASVSRLIDRFEYAALVAVVPVAGWVGGAYGLVGGTQP